MKDEEARAQLAYRLAFAAEQNPAYRLAVIDTARKYEPVPPDPDGAIRYAVVKMEGE
jgi:hypothetical protein